MLSLVSALLPADTDPRSYTPQEHANIETVLKLRSAPFSERKNYMHPAMVRHRWGFASLADVTGMKDGAGYDASTCSDRVDTIEDLIAKDDRVWAVWTMRGTHTGQLFGIPPTGKPIEILEAGIWRLADGLVIEAWFFGDELRLLRQLGVIDDARLRAASVRLLAAKSPPEAVAGCRVSSGGLATGTASAWCCAAGGRRAGRRSGSTSGPRWGCRRCCGGGAASVCRVPQCASSRSAPASSVPSAVSANHHDLVMPGHRARGEFGRESNLRPRKEML